MQSVPGKSQAYQAQPLSGGGERAAQLGRCEGERVVAPEEHQAVRGRAVLEQVARGHGMLVLHPAQRQACPGFAQGADGGAGRAAALAAMS